jgi:hypothetical protein
MMGEYLLEEESLRNNVERMYSAERGWDGLFASSISVIFSITIRIYENNNYKI